MTRKSASFPRPAARSGAASVLIILAGLFFVSGLSKLGLGVAAVIAAEDLAAIPGSGAQAEAPQIAATDDPRDLLASLRARAEELDALESALDARRDALSEAEAALAEQLQTLSDAEARLEARLRFSETAADADLERLTSVFEHMKPAEAAALFGQMETEFAAGFIARLRPDFAGQVMAGLDPLQAYAISAVLAGRNATAPRE